MRDWFVQVSSFQVYPSIFVSCYLGASSIFDLFGWFFFRLDASSSGVSISASLSNNNEELLSVKNLSGNGTSLPLVALEEKSASLSTVKVHYSNQVPSLVY